MPFCDNLILVKISKICMKVLEVDLFGNQIE